MVNRRGTGIERLGNVESNNEMDNGKPINVTAKFYLEFTNTRRKAFDGMR